MLKQLLYFYFHTEYVLLTKIDWFLEHYFWINLHYSGENEVINLIVKILLSKYKKELENDTLQVIQNKIKILLMTTMLI